MSQTPSYVVWGSCNFCFLLWTDESKKPPALSPWVRRRLAIESTACFFVIDFWSPQSFVDRIHPQCLHPLQDTGKKSLERWDNRWDPGAMGHHTVGLDLCGSCDAHLIYWTCTREKVTYEFFFYNRVGLCQLPAYEGELDFGGAVGRNQVLLGGNTGYEISYMACDGS